MITLLRQVADWCPQTHAHSVSQLHPSGVLWERVPFFLKQTKSLSWFFISRSRLSFPLEMSSNTRWAWCPCFLSQVMAGVCGWGSAHPGQLPWTAETAASYLEHLLLSAQVSFAQAPKCPCPLVWLFQRAVHTGPWRNPRRTAPSSLPHYSPMDWFSSLPCLPFVPCSPSPHHASWITSQINYLYTKLVSILL